MKELLLEQINELKKIKLPEGWKIAKLDVVFKKSGIDMYHNGKVIYDSMNDCFYVKTQKSIVYESESKVMEEAIKIMKKANKIIK